MLVEPPLEWQESEQAAGRDPTILWRMKKILYGRRKAPKEWLLFFGDLLKEIGLVQSSSAPHLFKSLDGQVLLEVHMDDIHACGPTLALKKLSDMIKARLSVKHANIFEYGSKARYQHLKRERIMDGAGCYIKPNPKYVEAATELLGVVDSKPVSVIEQTRSLRARSWTASRTASTAGWSELCGA